MNTRLVLDIIILQLEYCGDNLPGSRASFLLTITESLISSKHCYITPLPKNVMALSVLRKSTSHLLRFQGYYFDHNLLLGELKTFIFTSL